VIFYFGIQIKYVLLVDQLNEQLKKENKKKQ